MSDDSIPRPAVLNSVQSEILTRRFYEWERRGRGWQIWDGPVSLEPPFRPFVCQASAPEIVDDAVHEDLLSSIVKGVQRLLGGNRRPERTSAEYVEDLGDSGEGAEVFEDESPLVEMEVVLPPSLKVSKDFASQLLVALTYCKKALSFEVIGQADGVTVQLVCREDDRYPIREQVLSYFPEARIAEHQGRLVGSWSDHLDDAWVLVDFGLSQEFVRPLKTYGGFEMDPLIPVVGALSGLRPEELGVLQVLFQPVRSPWAESIFRSVTDSEGRALFANAPEMVSLAKQKIAHPLYAAVFRVAAQSPSADRAWRIVKSLGGALAQFASPMVNELIPLSNEGYPSGDHAADLVMRRSRRSGMLLNSEELVSLVHLPSASVRSQRLRRSVLKTKAAPDLALGHRLILGENEHDGEVCTVGLSPDQRVRHMHVIGASGTGKSTFLLNLICQDIAQGGGLAVLDPHGDLIDQILERIPEERLGDVVLLDPSDEEYPIGFNILSAHSETEKHLLASDLVSVFRRLSTSWGDQMTSVLGNAILSFLESDRGGTLADLRRFLVEKEYRQEFLQSVRDPENVYFWQKEFPLLTGKPQAPLLTRLDTFLRPKLIRHMVAQRENRFDFAEIMNGRKIFLAKLSQGAIGEENAYLLGTLLVSKFHQLALARQDMRADDREAFYLYIDEFHNFVTPSMVSILSGARKYRLGLILAHQELRQLGLGTSEIASAIISNPFARICFRLGDQDAAKLAGGFSFFDAKDLQNLGTGEALCRLERAEYDFNLRTAPLDVVDPGVAEERVRRILTLTRERYGTPRADVEAELAKHAVGLNRAPQAAVAVRQPKTEPTAKPEAESALAAKEPAAFGHEGIADGTATRPPGLAPLAPVATIGEPVAEYRVQPPTEPATKTRPATPREMATLGRGGQEHKHLQRLIKQWAEGMNWQATIEKSILNGAGCIDVALEKGDRLVACEICVTTPVEKEVANVEKCLRAGIGTVVSVASDAKHLGKIRDAVTKRLGAKDLSKVHFLDPDGLFRLVEEMDAAAASQEKRTKGYKVKTLYHAAEKGVKTARKRDISEAVVESIEALRRQQADAKGKSEENG